MTTVFVITAIAALVWGLVFFLHAGLLGTATAVLLTGSVFGYEFFHVRMSPMPVTVDRLLFAVMAGQYLVWRRWGLTDPKPMTRADWTLLVFLGWVFLRAVTPGNELPALPRFVLCHFMPLGVYWVVRQTRLTKRADRAVLVTFVVLAVYLCLTAIAEYLQLWWMVYPRHIYTAENTEFLGRARGPFLNPVSNGIAIGFGWLCALPLWFRADFRRRVILGMLMPLFAVGILLTLTRCVWLGALGALFVLLLMLLPGRRQLGLIVVTGFLGLVVLLTQWERLMTFKRDVHLSAEEAARSVELRPLLAVLAWKVFLDHPVAGCGLCQYDAVARYYAFDRKTGLPLEQARTFTQHNVFLSLLTETGIIGMSLFVAVLWLWFREGWKLWYDKRKPPWMRRHGMLLIGMLVMYVVNGMFHDLSQIMTANTYLFYAAGLAMNRRLVRAPASTPRE
jgi:O-antigen ligase